MCVGLIMVVLEIVGGKEVVFRFVNVLELIWIFNNLGDVKSLIIYFVIMMY